MEKKKNGFLVIPQEIMESLENQELTLNEAVTLAMIKSFATANKSFFMSNATLAKKLNMGLSTVKRVLKKLETKGFIEVEANENARYIKLCSQNIITPEHEQIQEKEQFTIQKPLPPSPASDEELTQADGSSEWTGGGSNWTTPSPNRTGGSSEWTTGGSERTTINTYTNTSTKIDINTSINTSSSSLPSSTDVAQNKNEEEEEKSIGLDEFVTKAIEIDSVCPSESHSKLFKLCQEKGIDLKDALLTLKNAKDANKKAPCNYLIVCLLNDNHLPLFPVLPSQSSGKPKINYESIKASQDIQSELCYKFGFEDSEARDFGDKNGWDKVGRNLYYVLEKYKGQERTKYLIQHAVEEDLQASHAERSEYHKTHKNRKRGAYSPYHYSAKEYQHIYV